MEKKLELWERTSVRILVLTPDQADYLRYRALLEAHPDLDPDLIWCPDITDCDDLIGNTRFDLVLWDCAYQSGSVEAFLQYLIVASDEQPVIALGADVEEDGLHYFRPLGALDYLCKGNLSTPALGRAALCACFRQQIRDATQGQLRQEVASGLINRDLFFDRLHQAILRAERQGGRLALIHINLDDFRSVNEMLGYQSGDQLMLRLAERLRHPLRRSDSLMRIGGDEFAVIVERIETSMDMTSVIKKLVKVLNDPVAVEGKSILLSASLGVASFPDAGQTAEALMRQANRAMFEAKQDAGTSYRFYDQTLHLSVGRQLALEADLRSALRGNQLELYYQPRVDLATGDIRGVECLLRWNHPQRGVVPPDEFIPTAERSGLIVPIGYWVIEQACERLKEIPASGLSPMVFAVNLSFRQFHDRRMTETIFRIIYNAGIDTSLMELELTESAMMHDPDYAQRCLRELSRLGVSFALDDFGTGFSSLSNLQHLPISLVKIDKSFVQKIGGRGDAEHIVRAIISLAHSLGMGVVAEGAETAEQVRFLQQQMCDQVQGFYYARPMPWQELLRFLEKASSCGLLTRNGGTLGA